jgi:NAD dependent epimerase/dehydratase family enzyme
MAKLRKEAKVPFGLPMPEFLLRFGAILIQTEVELILKSRKVISKRLEEAGFKFDFPTIELAFKDLV